MDNYSTYDLLKHHDMIHFIALDSYTKAKFNLPTPSYILFQW